MNIAFEKLSLWTTPYQTLDNQLEAVLKFVEEIAVSELQTDLASQAKKFSTLRPNYKTIPFQPHPEIPKYFDEVDLLYQGNPLAAFKLAVIVLVIARYSEPGLPFGEFEKRLLQWLIAPDLPRQLRIDLGVRLWIHLPFMGQNFKRDHLIQPLVQILVEEAEVAPEYASSIFDLIASQEGAGGDRRTYLFNSFAENPDDFLQFAKFVHKQHPELLVSGLQHCLYQCRCYQRRKRTDTEDYFYQPSENRLREVSAELFDGLDAWESPESVLHQLILDAYPDEIWYPTLFERLWNLEKIKPLPDTNTIKNCYLVVINAPNSLPMRAEAQEKIRQWAFSYKTLYESIQDNLAQYRDWKFWPTGRSIRKQELIDHARSLIESINDASHPEYPQTRNKSLSVPTECQIVGIAVEAYWQMVDWLEKTDTYLTLQVLVVGVAPRTFAVPLTVELAEQAKTKFLALFDSFLPDHIEESTVLIEQMINDTRYTGYKETFGPLLDNIYPKLYALDSHAAKTAHESAKKNNAGHSYCW